MYKLHLILKYLRKRRIAWVSLIAVTLCTAMVLVVLSVMGGWLRMFEENFHALSGDVLITANRSWEGFAYYPQIIEEVEKLPEVEAAVPVIQTYGLVNIGNQLTRGAQVVGYPLDQIGKVNSFPESLYFQHLRYVEQAEEPDQSSQRRDELLKQAQLAKEQASFHYRPLDRQTYDRPGMRSANWPGIIMGAGLLDIRKDKEGNVVGRELWKYELPVKLVLFGTRSLSATDPGAVSQRAYWIADDSRTKVYLVDSSSVYVPFDILQRDLDMDARGEEPARTSEIHVAVKDGVDLQLAKRAIQSAVDRVFDQARQKEDEQGLPRWSSRFPKVETWRENKAMFIGAVENETTLVVFLFSMISVVAIFLIFCIFYMIVVEKTRDVGIIKSVGATSGGVAGIFLGYGAAIGIVGGGLGLLVGYLIVKNINEIHAWVAWATGRPIWNPEVYVFDVIPSEIVPMQAAVIVAVAIASSIIGALVPAMRAARMNPVEAVRYE